MWVLFLIFSLFQNNNYFHPFRNFYIIVRQTGKKPFECNLCGKRFTQGMTVKTHKALIHVSAKIQHPKDAVKLLTEFWFLVCSLFIRLPELRGHSSWVETATWMQLLWHGIWWWHFIWWTQATAHESTQFQLHWMQIYSCNPIQFESARIKSSCEWESIILKRIPHV